MPIYEFKCKNCGNIFEYLCFRSNDKNQAMCPKCGHKDAETMLSVFSSKGSSTSDCMASGGFT